MDDSRHNNGNPCFLVGTTFAIAIFCNKDCNSNNNIDYSVSAKIQQQNKILVSYVPPTVRPQIYS